MSISRLRKKTCGAEHLLKFCGRKILPYLFRLFQLAMENILSTTIQLIRRSEEALEVRKAVSRLREVVAPMLRTGGPTRIAPVQQRPITVKGIFGKLSPACCVNICK